jgi:hypothetical protein
MTSKAPMRTMEDIDEKALSYGEIKALATGNDDIKKKIELEADVSKLKILKQSFLSQRYDLEDKITRVYPQIIQENEEKIKLYENDKKQLEENTHPNEDGFCKMVLKGKEYVQKEKAGKNLLELCSKKQNKEFEEIGEYRGFKLELGYDPMLKEFKLNIKNKISMQTELGKDVFGNIRRIDNTLEKIDFYIKDYTEQLEDTKKQLEIAKIEVQKPFIKEQELKEKMKELDKINISLNLNEKDNQILDTRNDNEKEDEIENIDKEKTKNNRDSR